MRVRVEDLVLEGGGEREGQGGGAHVAAAAPRLLRRGRPTW
jgi:hypothetical protein